MKNIKVGFIGTGNMGGAIARAVAKQGYTTLLSSHSIDKATLIAQETGAEVVSTKNICATCDYIFVGVKPQKLVALSEEIKDYFGNNRPILISMAASVDIAKLKSIFGDYLYIRIMPNTPVAVGKGLTVYSLSQEITKEQEDTFLDMMSQSGNVCPINEDKIDIEGAIAGSGPAFVYMFAEAMRDGAMKLGLDEATAYDYAIDTIIGAGEMMKRTHADPDTLRANVCSPGGTTIEGVRVLRENNMHDAVVDCIDATYQKTLYLKKQ